MPRKPAFAMEHVKTVKRGGVEYLYFNTGQKVDGKTVYTALGKKGDVSVGSRYSAALAARGRRDGSPTALTVPQLAQRFWSSPDFRKRSDGTQKTYLVYLRRLAKEFDTAPAGALESSDIYELMDEMAGSPAGIDMMLLAGGQMYRWGLKRKYVAHNPFESVDREDWEGRQYEPWPLEAIEAALEVPKLRLPVALLYYTAQRIGDVCRMRWSDINGGEIAVVQQKTKKAMHIPLHSRLREILEEAPRTNDTILTSPNGGRAKDQTIRLWIKAFGVERGLNLVPHGLRKNAVNALLEAGCATGEVSSISGQSLRMVEHYARRRNDRIMGRAAISRWERTGDKETGGKISPEMADL